MAAALQNVMKDNMTVVATTTFVARDLNSDSTRYLPRRPGFQVAFKLAYEVS
jgi:hypothetical protein